MCFVLRKNIQVQFHYRLITVAVIAFYADKIRYSPHLVTDIKLQRILDTTGYRSHKDNFLKTVEKAL